MWRSLVMWAFSCWAGKMEASTHFRENPKNSSFSQLVPITAMKDKQEGKKRFLGWHEKTKRTSQHWTELKINEKGFFGFSSSFIFILIGEGMCFVFCQLLYFFQPYNFVYVGCFQCQMLDLLGLNLRVMIRDVVKAVVPHLYPCSLWSKCLVFSLNTLKYFVEDQNHNPAIKLCWISLQSNIQFMTYYSCKYFHTVSSLRLFFLSVS